MPEKNRGIPLWLELTYASVIACTVQTVVNFAMNRKRKNQEERSTTSAAGGGASAYENQKAVHEYVQFHYGAPGDVLPYPEGPMMLVKVCSRLT